jgi:hypothetical protein
MNNAGFSPTGSLILGGPFVIESRRLSDRLLARLYGASLDHQLAEGCPPELTRLLAARAQDIVALPRRTSLARSWAHLLRVARRSPSHPTPIAPVRSAAILAAEPAIRELIERLTAPLPVSAQGVAAASVLLTNANSPVYSRRSPCPLADLLQAAITQLDPARPLIGAAAGRVLGCGYDDSGDGSAGAQRQSRDRGRRGDDL